MMCQPRVLNISISASRARAKLDDVRIHDLRHSYASGALALGEGLPMIGKLLGHTQVQTTARYAHLANDPVKAAGSKVSDMIGAAMFGGTKKLKSRGTARAEKHTRLPARKRALGGEQRPPL